MGFSLKSFLGAGVDKVVGAVGDAIDKNVTSKEEKAILKNQVTGILVDYQKASEVELTKRLEIDMNSDSWLSKNIRPMTLIVITAAVVSMTMFHGNIGDFTIDTSYVDLWKSVMIMIYAFYFGSRGIEKSIQSINKVKEKK